MFARGPRAKTVICETCGSSYLDDPDDWSGEAHPETECLLSRLVAAEAKIREFVDGWRAEADRARATGLTIEAVRGLVEAWDRADISFSRMVEDLRTLAMVRAETAERERDEARAALAEAERIGCLACRVREENGG